MKGLVEIYQIASQLEVVLANNAVTPNDIHRLELEYAQIAIDYKNQSCELLIQFQIYKKEFEGTVLFPPKLQIRVSSIAVENDNTKFTLRDSLAPWNGPDNYFSPGNSYMIEPSASAVVEKMHECYMHNYGKRIFA